ncbi:MAG TPA: helix-turn-helix domain-containing protein [Rhizomicrobium sp.]|nr:helix-turn-helix domain-containing protein [Rhizomicrobium sp.]
MPKTSPPPRRSGCPLNASLEMVGDRWSLLIVRDMMLRGASTFAEFLDGHEQIATNILADRLARLTEDGIIEAAAHPGDGRKKIYRLTKKGIDLAPVLTEMVLWASAHEATGNQALIRRMRDKAAFLDDVRARWQASGRGRG